jgi:hypothetical protein
VIDEEYLGARQWSRNKQAFFTVVWISFLTAAVSTMAFFALFDPIDLSSMFDENLHLSRDAGYAAGFFFFWAICAACAGLTAYLVRTAPRRKSKQ